MSLDLDEAERLLECIAPEAPWYAHGDLVVSEPGQVYPRVATTYSHANAAFIAFARSFVPEAVEEIRSAINKNAALREEYYETMNERDEKSINIEALEKHRDHLQATNTAEVERRRAAEKEVERLNKWADDYTDKLLNERRLAEELIQNAVNAAATAMERIRQLEKERDALRAVLESIKADLLVRLEGAYPAPGTMHQRAVDALRQSQGAQAPHPTGESGESPDDVLRRYGVSQEKP